MKPYAKCLKCDYILTFKEVGECGEYKVCPNCGYNLCRFLSEKEIIKMRFGGKKILKLVFILIILFWLLPAHIFPYLVLLMIPTFFFWLGWRLKK